MEYERIWHGIRFEIDAYYEFGDGIDSQAIQIDILSKEVIDTDEASLWPHGIPASPEAWRKVEDEFANEIAQEIEKDIERDRQESRLERLLSDREQRYY